MDDRRVLVTGGSGFIGTNLVTRLRQAGIRVLSVDVSPPRDAANEGVHRQGDVKGAPATFDLLQDFAPTDVLHMAARTDLRGRTVEDYSDNTEGVASILSAISRAPSVRRVVFASSRLVCRTGYQPVSDDDYCPPNAYGASKVDGEQRVRAADLGAQWLIVRPTSIWGPWFEVPYKDFFTSIANGRYVHPRGRAIHKSFGFVGNTVHQLMSLMDAPPASVQGRTFYLGDYPPIEVGHMADEIRRQLGLQPVRRVPLPVLALLAKAGDVLARLGMSEPPLTSFRLENLLTEMVYEDLGALQAVVGDLPYTAADGIRDTLAWLDQHRG